jgi:hypothetical protein
MVNPFYLMRLVYLLLLFVSFNLQAQVPAGVVAASTNYRGGEPPEQTWVSADGEIVIPFISDSMLKTADGTGPPTPIDNAVYEWDDNAVVEITSDSYNSNGGTICPQLGNNIFTALGYKTVFVNKASSGSSYSPSLDDNNWTLDGDLYTDAITEIDECLVAVGVDRPAYIIWNLGVNDSSDPSDINDVETDLKSLFERVTTKYPNTPILVCQNGNFLTTSYQTATQRQALIRKWHKEMVELYPNAHFVDINAAYYGVSGMQISNTAHHTQAGLNMKADKILRWLQHDSYTKWARSIIASQFVELTTPQKDAIQDFVNTEVYDALDIFLPFKNQPDRSCIFLDWEFLAAPYDAAGNVGFDEDLGITTDRDNTYYYRTNYNPSWHTMNASATDFWYGLKVGDNSTAAGTLATVMGGVGAYFQQTAASLISYRCNDGTNTTTNVNTSFQDATFYAAGRSGTTKYLWINDAQAASATVTNTGLASTLMYVGARNTGSSSAEWITANIEYVFAGSQDIDKDQARQDMEAVIDGFAVKEYVPFPDAPTLSDTHTLNQPTTGSGIQIGDLNGKIQFFVGTDYPFMQFNVVNEDSYSLMSEDYDEPSEWAIVGSPSPNDFSIDEVNAAHGYSFYRLRFEGSDNLIKKRPFDTLGTLLPVLFQNCIFRNAGFGGILINQSIAGRGYGKLNVEFCSFTGEGAERIYAGSTGSATTKYRDTTTVTHLYSDSSRREVVQLNNHRYVKVSNITGRHVGIVLEDPDQGIGQKNGLQCQGCGGGYIKNSIFESVAPAMIASTSIDIINNRFEWSTTNRQLYLQDLNGNGYAYKNVDDDTVVIEGNDFICPGYTLDNVIRIQEDDLVVVIRNNRFPPSATNIYECDGGCPTVITEGNTFDSDEIPPVVFVPHPDPAYADFWWVVDSDYDYNLGRGALTPEP